LFVLLGAVGMFAADRLVSGEASSPSNVTVWEQTVRRTVTAGRDRVVTQQIIRYVRKSRVKLRTQTSVVTTKRVVTKPVLVTRTVVAEHTVTQSRRRLVTRTITRSLTNTTPPVTVTAPAVTLTQTLPAQTVIVTVTVKHGDH
jgi:hypothetical protein